MVFAKVKQLGNRVIVLFDGQPKDDEECTAYLQLLDKVYLQKKKFIILYDARKIGWLSWKHIKRQAEFMKTKEPQTKLYMERAAVVVKSLSARSVLNTLFSIRKPVAPVHVFTNIHQAKDYLRDARLPIDNKLKTQVLTDVNENLNATDIDMENLEKMYNATQV